MGLGPKSRSHSPRRFAEISSNMSIPSTSEFEGREQHHCEEVCGLKVVRIAPAGRPRRLVRLEEHESPEQVAFVVRSTELVHADVSKTFARSRTPGSPIPLITAKLVYIT